MQAIQKKKIKVTWNLTNDCNLNCKHCKNANEKPKSWLSYNQLRIILHKLYDHAGIIVFSGGEPFSVPFFADFLEEVNLYNIKIRILSNGTLIDRLTSFKLRSINIDFVQISIDGATSYTHDFIRGKGCFQETLIGIENVKIAEKKIILSFTPMKTNFFEIEDFFKLALFYQIKNVHFPLLIEQGNAKGNQDIILDYEHLYEVYKTIHELCKKYNIVFNAEYNRKAIFKKGDIQQRNCGIGSEILINHSGDVFPCTNLEYDEHNCGNLLEKSFSNLYYHSEKLCKYREINPYHINSCYNCKFIQYCLGGCRAYAYESTGDIKGKDPTCLFNFNHYSLMQI